MNNVGAVVLCSSKVELFLRIFYFHFHFHACIDFIYKKGDSKICQKLVIVAKLKKQPKILIAQEKSNFRI